MWIWWPLALTLHGFLLMLQWFHSTLMSCNFPPGRPTKLFTWVCFAASPAPVVRVLLLAPPMVPQSRALKSPRVRTTNGPSQATTCSSWTTCGSRSKKTDITPSRDVYKRKKICNEITTNCKWFWGTNRPWKRNLYPISFSDSQIDKKTVSKVEELQKMKQQDSIPL